VRCAAIVFSDQDQGSTPKVAEKRRSSPARANTSSPSACTATQLLTLQPAVDRLARRAPARRAQGQAAERILVVAQGIGRQRTFEGRQVQLQQHVEQ
jgi:hypothetical protein